VGGCAYNGLLCQMTASATGKSVIAGPAEASAVGNLLAQFEVAGVITSDPPATRHRPDLLQPANLPAWPGRTVAGHGGPARGLLNQSVKMLWITTREV